MTSLKKAIIGASMGALLLASTAFPALAGAGKAPLFDSVAYTCAGGASSTSGSTFGFAVINTNNAGNLEVQVSLKGATPNASYDIYVNQDLGGCPTGVSGVLTTNGQGNGNAHVEIPAVAGAVNYWVSAVGGGQVLRSTAVTSP